LSPPFGPPILKPDLEIIIKNGIGHVINILFETSKLSISPATFEQYTEKRAID
jgi:hypothetical protein